MEVWIDEESREFEDNITELCQQLEEAWLCVEDTIETLGPKQKLIVGMMMRGIRDAVKEICSRELIPNIFI